MKEVIYIFIVVTAIQPFNSATATFHCRDRNGRGIWRTSVDDDNGAKHTRFVEHHHQQQQQQQQRQQ
jgi:hypothetical protein